MQQTHETADPAANEIGGRTETPSSIGLQPLYPDCPWPVYAARDEWHGAEIDRVLRATGATALLTLPYTWLDGSVSAWWCAYYEGTPIGTLYESEAMATLVLTLEAMRP